MERVDFISSTTGDDLIVAFAVNGDDPFAIESLILLRTPKYECFLFEAERGVGVSFERYPHEKDNLLRELSFLESEQIVRLKTQKRDYELDVRKVKADEIRQMRQVLRQMNFDHRLKMTGIDDSSAAANPEPSFDPHSILRSLERQRARSEGQPPDRAQELFYRAMDAPNAEESLALLEQALTLDPENVDALLAVLGHQQLSPEEQIPRLRRVVELAQRRLGETVFKEFAGKFWDFIETRPYMRARRFLAEALSDAGHLEEAIQEWEAMLELNPLDNQAVRYSLLAGYLTLNRLEDARKLFAKNPEECSWNTLLPGAASWSASYPEMPRERPGHWPLRASKTGVRKLT